MATEISAVNVKLTAGVGGFAAGMKGAAKSAQSFGNSIKGSLGGLVGWTSAIAGLVGAGSLTVLTKQAMSGIDATAKLSDQIGIATEKLVGLQHAADLSGVGTEAFNKSLQKMTLNIADAANGTGTALETFKRLGLSTQALSAMSPDEQFKAIADAINGLGNQSEKAAAAYDIFGREGVNLLNTLSLGSEGLAAAQAEAEKLGITFTRLDAAKVEAANDAMSRAGKVFQGVGQILAVELSPYITAIASKFVEAATSGEGMSTKIVGAVEWVTKAIATVADYLELPKAGFYLLQAGATLAIKGLMHQIDWLGRGLVWLANLIPGVELEFTSFFGDLAEGLNKDISDSFEKAGKSFDNFMTGANSAAVTRTFNDIKAGANEAAQAIADAAEQNKNNPIINDDEAKKNAQGVIDAIAKIKAELANFGKSEDQIKLDELAAKGATPEQLAEAKAALDKLKALKDQQTAAEKAADAQKDLEDAAKRVFESTRTPMEKYESQIGELNKLVQAGVLDWDTYGRAVQQAIKERDQAAGVDDAPAMSDKRAALVNANSAEAQLIRYEMSRATPKTETLEQKQYAEAQEQTSYLKDTVAQLKRLARGTNETIDI